MPERVELQELVATIALDSSRLEEGSQRSQEALEDVRLILQRLGVESGKAEKILGQCFSDTSKVEGYISKMDLISAKMDGYREQLKELQKAEEDGRKQWEAWNQTAGSAHPYVSQYTGEIEKLNQKIAEQEGKFQAAENALDSYVKKTAEGYDKLNSRHMRADTMGAMSLATTALRNIKGLAPEVNGSLTTIIFNIRAIRSAMRQGQSAGLLWGSVIVAAVGAVMNVVQNAFDKYFAEMDEATKRQQESLNAMIDNAKQYTKDLDDLIADSGKKLAEPYGEAAKLQAQLSVYDSLREKVWLTEEEKRRLDTVAKALSDTLDLEEVQLKSIDGVYRDLTADVAEYIRTLKEQATADYYADVVQESAVSVERLKQPIEDAKKAWDDAEDKLDELKQKFKEKTGFEWESGFGEMTAFEQDPITLEYKLKLNDADARNMAQEIQKAEKEVDSLRLAWSYLEAESVSAGLKGEEAADKLSSAADKEKESVGLMMGGMAGLMNIQQAALLALAQGLEQEKDNAEETAGIYQTAADKVDEWKAKLTEANKTLEDQSVELRNLKRDEKAAEETIAKMTKVIMEGKDEAGDALSTMMKAQSRLSETKSKLAALSAEIFQQRQIIKQVKEEYDALAEAAKPLKEKMQDIAKESSTLRSALNNLGSMMKQVESGQALNLDTLIELIEQYPQYTDALIGAKDSADLQRQALQLLFQAKKEEYILSLQASQAKILTSREETVQILSDLEKQAKAFESMGPFFGKIFSDMTSAKIKELKDSLDAYDNLEKRIEFIRNLNISDLGTDGSGSSKVKTALQKYLDQLDDLKELDQLTLQQEINSLEWALKHYTATAEEKHDIDVRLHRARKKLQEEQDKAAEDQRKKEVDALNTLGDAVLSALKNKYDQQKKIEEQRIQESIDNWKNWEDQTVKAIQGQIDALDDLKKAHDEENKRAEYEQKRKAMQLELRFEKDNYNRERIQKQIAALDKEEQERLYEVEIDFRKEQLLQQKDAAQQLSAERQKSLAQEKESVTQKYDSLTSNAALQGEAKKLLVNSSQQELTSLINTYAPEVEMLGQKLGESLYEAFRSKSSNIVSWVDRIAQNTDTAAKRSNAADLLERYIAGAESRQQSLQSNSPEQAQKALETMFNRYLTTVPAVSAYKNQMAVTADTTAQKIIAPSHTTVTGDTVSTQTVNVYLTANFNGQVDSPVQIRRQLEQWGYSIAKQLS